ncbi:MAG: hypothetical protein ABR969_08595 [Sedimentisphaerales bacterium]|jgi:hypothetical protein
MKKKQDNKMFINLPDCAGEYIRLVIKKMRWQKKVRGDVQAELIAHFEDALKDCKTNEEREKTAKEIISEFGDAKMLAILARRAKKRCQSLWQKMFTKACQISGIIIVLFILYVIWFISGKPKITTDYVAQLNQIARPSSTDETLNAAYYYNQAGEKIDKLPEEMTNIFAKSYFECNEPEKKQAEEWLTKNQEILNLVIAGSDKPYCWDKYYTEQNNVMFAVLLPHPKEYKNIARILCFKACFSASEGNYSQGLENILTALKLGKHIKTEPFLIEQIVGIAIESSSVQNLRQILSRYNIDKSELAKLQCSLETIVREDIFRITFKGERMCFYDAIQRSFTDDIFGGHIYVRGDMGIMDDIIDGPYNNQTGKREQQDFPETLKKLFSILFTQPGKKETLKSSDEIYDYYEKLSALTPFEQQSIEPNTNEKLKEIAGKNIFLTMLAPVFNKLVTMPYRNKAEIQATTTIIAIIRYKQENGAYPDNLEGLLNKSLIKEIPADPFSDKPLVYKKTEKGFTLYSVGEDFVDNGGIMGVDKDGKPRLWNETGSDAVFWPVANPGQKPVTGGK